MKSLIAGAGLVIVTGAAYAQDLSQIDPPRAPVRFPSEFRIIDARSLPALAVDLSVAGRSVIPLSETDPELPIQAISSEWRHPVGGDAVLVETLSIRRSIAIQASDSAGHDARPVVRDIFTPISELVDPEDLTRYLFAIEADEADIVGSGSLDASPGLPEEALLLSLSIDRDDLVFSVMESVADITVPSIRHVTAVMLNGGGYVRLAIDELTGMMAGTVQSDSWLYRILSHPTEPVELVFGIPPREVGSADRYLALTNFLPVSTELQRLEQRHLAAEALADIQPSSYTENIRSMSSDVLMHIDPDREDGISRVDPSRLADPDMVARLMNELGSLLRVKGDEEYGIVSVSTDSDEEGWRIEFRQLIDGIPFARSNGTIQIAPEGDVRSLRLRNFLDTSEFLVEPLQITLQQAGQFALAELGQQVPGATIEGQGQTVYDHDRVSQDRLVPIGQFTYVGGGTARAGQVLVFMHTGEVLVLSRRRPR